MPVRLPSRFAISGVLVDLSPLRNRVFRRLWSGGLVSAIGTQVSVVAVAFEIYRVTGSDLDVGLISFVELVPAFVGSVVGGSIADAMDRRKLLILTGLAMALSATGMAVNVDRPHPSILLLYVIGGVAAGVQGINNPAQTSAMLAVVDRADMVTANVLRQLSNQVSIVLGPSLAGVLIASFGVKFAFWANAASFVIAIVAVASVGPRPPVGGTTRFGWRSISEGFAFLRSSEAMCGVIIGDLNVTVLGWPIALFPAMATTHFHGGARLVGLLYSTPGIGACVGVAFSGWTAKIRRAGLAIVIGSVMWGVAIIAFGLIPSATIAILCLGVGGALDTTTSVFRTTIIQTETPDRLRGRISSLQMALMGNGPRVGNTESGLVAAATNTQFAVVSGGIGTVVGIAIVARLLPRFLHYESPGKEIIVATER
jgi:MFS family permease